MQKLFLKRRTKKGFTLVELLIVLAILGILGAMVVAYLMTSSTTEAKANKIWEVIAKTVDAIQAYSADTSQFPSAIKELWTGKDSNGNPIPGWKRAYLMPQNPDDENLDLSSIVSGATLDVECTAGTDGKVDIVISNLPKSIVQVLDKDYDKGSGATSGRIQWDDSSDPTTLHYTVAYGQFITGGIVCTP